MGTAILPSSCYYLLLAGDGQTTERMFSKSIRQRPLWADSTFAGASPGDAGTASPGDAGNVVSNRTPLRNEDFRLEKTFSSDGFGLIEYLSGPPSPKLDI